jgi:hypothetical protein
LYTKVYLVLVGFVGFVGFALKYFVFYARSIMDLNLGLIGGRVKVAFIYYVFVKLLLKVFVFSNCALASQQDI